MRTKQGQTRAQIVLGLLGIAACLLPCAAQAGQRVHAGPRQKVQTLFAIVAARARKEQQAYWQQCLRSHDTPSYVYHVLEIAPYARQYRIADWKPVPVARAAKLDGGLSGDWAQVVEKGMDKRGAWSDQGGYALYHRLHGRWQRVASHEGLGYDPKDIRTARVPAAIVTRLKLNLND